MVNFIGTSLSNTIDRVTSGDVQTALGEANRNPLTGATDIPGNRRDPGLDDISLPPRPEHRVRLTVLNFVNTQTLAQRRKLPSLLEVLFSNDAEQLENQAHLLHPLRDFGGILFPYTPTITFNSQTTYSFYEPVHSIQDFASYQRTMPPEFQISAEFTVQNIDEGRYALACIHFLRVVSKMYFGRNTRKGGTPPPVLQLSGYGDLMFNQIPVVVTSYTMDLQNDVDYVEIPVTDTNSKLNLLAEQEQQARGCAEVQGQGQNNKASRSEFVTGGSTTAQVPRAWLPAKFLMTVALKPTRTPKQAREFNLDDFRKGNLLGNDRAGTQTTLTGGGWW